MRLPRLPVLLGAVFAFALLLSSCQSGTAAAPPAISTPALSSSAASNTPTASATSTSDSQATDAVSESATGASPTPSSAAVSSSAALPSTAAAASPAAVRPTATSPAAVRPASAVGAGACSLISQQEAGAAIGSPVGAGTLSGNVAAGYTECEYGTANSADGSLSVYMVTVNGKADFLHATSKTSGHTSKVTGIGDGAFGTFAGAHAAIEFYRGDTLVTVILATGSGSAKDKTMALASTAAGRV